MTRSQFEKQFEIASGKKPRSKLAQKVLAIDGAAKAGSAKTSTNDLTSNSSLEANAPSSQTRASSGDGAPALPSKREPNDVVNSISKLNLSKTEV
jgi:hypothetical protein